MPSQAHHPSGVTAVEVLEPGRAVSVDLDGGLCLWQRGVDDAMAYRPPRPAKVRSMYGSYQIVAAGNCIVVRERAGFFVFEGTALKLITRLQHKNASSTVTDGTTLITAGGKLVQAFRIGTWERIASREDFGPDTMAMGSIGTARLFSFTDRRGVIGLASVDDLKTRKSRSFAEVKGASNLAADPRGSSLAFSFVGGEDGTSRVRMWDLSTGGIVTLVLRGWSDAVRLTDDELLVLCRSADPGAPLLVMTWYGLDGTEHRQLDVRATFGPSQSADGAWGRPFRSDVLVFHQDNCLSVVDAKTGDLRSRHVKPALLRLSSPLAFDGDSIVAGGDDGRVTWLGQRA